MKPAITGTGWRAGLSVPFCAGPACGSGGSSSASRSCLPGVFLNIGPAGKELKLSRGQGGAFQSPCLPVLGPAVTHCLL